MSGSKIEYCATSLCEVYSDQGLKKLARLLDYDNGQFSRIPETSERPVTLKYYDVLYYQYNQFSVNIGDLNVWDWQGTASNSNSNSNSNSGYRIISELNPDLIPIEVVWATTANTLEEITSLLLQDGIPYNTSFAPSTPILFVTRRGTSGLLFQKSDLLINPSGHLTVSSQVREAELYENTLPQHILKTTSARTNTTRYFWDQPYKKRITTYSFNLEPLIIDAIKTRLLDTHKPKEIKALEELLLKTSRGSISDEVARRSGASDAAITEAIDKFLNNIPYLGESSDVKILATVLEKVPSLYQKCVQEVERTLRIQVPEMFIEAEKQIEKCQQQLADKQKELAELDELLALAHEEEKQLSTSREQFKNQIEKSLAEFQNNTGSFLAEVTTLNLAWNGIINQSQRSSNSTGASLRNLFLPGTPIEKTESEVYNECDDIIYAVDSCYCNNLIDKRINDALPLLFSAFMYAAYQRRISLVLLGPGAVQLAEIFSGLINAKKPDVLNCDGDWDQAAVDQAFADPDSILLVKNPFNGAWLDRLIVEIARSSKMVILVSPFLDDLRIEPSGLFDYVVPVITTPFIMPNYIKNPTFGCGRKAEDFVEFECASEVNRKHLKKAKALGFGRILRYTTAALIADVIKQFRLNEDHEEVELFCALIGLYPYSLISGRENEFLEQNKESRLLAKFLE